MYNSKQLNHFRLAVNCFEMSCCGGHKPVGSKFTAPGWSNEKLSMFWLFLLLSRSDKTLQNIVYKLVPGLYKSETDRRKKFQEKRKNVLELICICLEIRLCSCHRFHIWRKWKHGEKCFGVFSLKSQTLWSTKQLLVSWSHLFSWCLPLFLTWK